MKTYWKRSLRSRLWGLGRDRSPSSSDTLSGHRGEADSSCEAPDPTPGLRLYRHQRKQQRSERQVTSRV